MAAVDAGLALVPPVWPAGGPPVVAVVDLPAGTGAATVATGTVRVLVDGAWVGIGAVRAVAGDRLLVTFDGAEVRGRLAGYRGTVKVTVTGHLTTGDIFTATDTVRLR